MIQTTQRLDQIPANLLRRLARWVTVAAVLGAAPRAARRPERLF